MAAICVTAFLGLMIFLGARMAQGRDPALSAIRTASIDQLSGSGRAAISGDGGGEESGDSGPLDTITSFLDGGDASSSSASAPSAPALSSGTSG